MLVRDDGWCQLTVRYLDSGGRVPWLVVLLLGFTTDGGPQPGPPSPHLAYTSHLQARWSGESAWFREVHGRWAIRWDERNHTPRALMGPGSPEAHAELLAADVARLGGVDPTSLLAEGRRTRGERSVVRFTQHWRGAPIVDAGLDVISQHGRVHLIWARLHRPGLGDAPLPGEVVLPLDRDGRLTYHLATEHHEGDDVVYVDRDGRELLRWSHRLPLELDIPERTVGDERVRVPARQVTVSDASGETLTDDAGLHDRESPVEVAFVGPFLEVLRDETTVVASGIDDELIVGGEDVSQAAAAVQHHTHAVRDWLEERMPEHPWLPQQIPAAVDLEGQCNAFYTRGTINFLSAGGDCVNFGVIADVVFHEFGHGVHDRGLLAGSFAGDVSEGSADYVSATLLDDPRVGLGAFGPGSLIRDLEPDRVYPFDAVGQVHNDGLIWGSFLWNLRQLWIDEHGPAEGARRTDELFLDALSLGPGLTDLYEAVLAADDDDGDLSNGTPHGCELVSLLDQHGIGPGPIGYVVLEHTPPEDQPSTRDDRVVTWTLTNGTPDCARFDPDGARLRLVEEPSGAPESWTWTEVVPERTGSRYTATLPARPAGGRTVYHLSWTTETGEYPNTSHGDDPEALYDVWWGDTTPLWCDDMESGQGAWLFATGALDGAEPSDEWRSEWAVAPPPDEASNSPSRAVSGAAVLGTQLEGDGQYGANNSQYALSPLVDFGLAHPAILRLETQRWLTVERSRYDQATLTTLAPDGSVTELWRNPFGEDVLDRAWARWRTDLRGLGEEAAHFAWTLTTDQGLEYGGWHLDDVCVVTLDEPARHYRVQDLTANEGADAIELSWTDPWVMPLDHSVLVRKHGSAPTGPDDGDRLGVFPGEPGASRAYLDSDAAAFQLWDWHYAVFASDGSTLWSDVVTGENAVAVSRVPSTAPSGSSSSTAPGDESRRSPTTGCSCGASPTPGSWPMLLLLLALGRRRR